MGTRFGLTPDFYLPLRNIRGSNVKLLIMICMNIYVYYHFRASYFMVFDFHDLFWLPAFVKRSRARASKVDDGLPVVLRSISAS